MEKITVTVIVNIPGDDFTHIHTRAFETTEEMYVSLPTLDSEDWHLTSVGK